MNISLNSKKHTVAENLLFNELKMLSRYSRSKKLLYIQNGHIVDQGARIKENDELFIIPKDMEIDEGDLECFLTSRHSRDVIKRLKSSRVAILGLGGLGSNVAINLARSGVGFLKLIDFDLVDPSNINRQNYFLDQIAMKKTDASIANIKRVNPYISLHKEDVYLNRDNFKDHLMDVDIIVEAFDNPSSKAELTNYFIENYDGVFKDKYLITGSGMAGYYKSNIIQTKRLKERLYICGDLLNSAREFDGLMAPRVSIVSAHQANCVIRILMEQMEV